MKKVVVYTITPCPYCTSAKSLLTQRGIAFEEIWVDRNDDEKREALLARSGMRTFPQIFAGDQLIGGYEQLADLDRQDQLKSLR
ncbi:MAG: glutaredoxin 3 [Bacteriovoracia bacterium]